MKTDYEWDDDKKAKVLDGGVEAWKKVRCRPI